MSDANFVTKDSGQRLVNPSGMQRDVATDKIDYSLVFDGPMFKRWAALLDRGARKYDKRNWMKANSQDEYDRAKESLVRHLIQYLDGETDEDHAAAVFFNINEMEYIKDRWKGLKTAKILLCPVCKHELTRKIFNEQGCYMVAYVCDAAGMHV